MRFLCSFIIQSVTMFLGENTMKTSFKMLLMSATVLVMLLAFLLTFYFTPIYNADNCYVGKATVNNEIVLSRANCASLHYR